MIEKIIAISQKKEFPGNLELVQCALFLYTYMVHFAPPSFTSLSLTLSNISMMVQRGTVAEFHRIRAFVLKRPYCLVRPI